MSEAEIHVLRARLRGGILNKARRGELQSPLPVGFLYDAAGRVVLDPDQQVQASLRYLFETFDRTGSARATVKAFREQGLRFPRRLRAGPHKGELVWGPLDHWRVLQILHNPRYAGAFFFGRLRTRRRPDGGSTTELLPRDQWYALVPDAHPGYLTWAAYEAHQWRLREGAQAHGTDRRRSPPREGPALLQGLVVCGRCGTRMTVRYHSRSGRLQPEYVCQRTGIRTATRICQQVPGAGVDEAIRALVLETVTPLALDVALAVQRELEQRLDEADRLRHQHVERARYEADLAQRRYLQVDPDHRLVADTLEAEWNAKLRALADAQAHYEQQRAAAHRVLDDEARARIRTLATDVPRLWREPTTPQRERKRMVRLLLEDVTLVRGDTITVHVRFKGGTTTSRSLPRPPTAWQLRQTPPAVVAEIDHLLDAHTEGEIATILNARGRVSGEGRPFHPRLVHRLRHDYGLRSRYQRLRDAGLLTLSEIAAQLRVCRRTVTHWREAGLLRAHAYTDKPERLYEPPGPHPPLKMQGRKLSQRPRFPDIVPNGTKEV